MKNALERMMKSKRRWTTECDGISRPIIDPVLKNKNKKKKRKKEIRNYKFIAGSEFINSSKFEK